MIKFSKTTILTLGMDIMTMTIVNNFSRMGNNFKCWQILSISVSFVMVNVHGRTATIQPEQDFNHPPPPSPMAKIHLDAHFPPRGFPKPDRNIRKSYFAFSQGSTMKNLKQLLLIQNVPLSKSRKGGPSLE